MTSDGMGRRPKSDAQGSREVVRLKLVARLYELADLLNAHPRADLPVLREVLHDVRALYQGSRIDHGLLSLVLRNMVRDLSGAAAQFEATYYAKQLIAAADQIRTM
jgi:hypothetical protein